MLSRCGVIAYTSIERGGCRCVKASDTSGMTSVLGRGVRLDYRQDEKTPLMAGASVCVSACTRAGPKRNSLIATEGPLGTYSRSTSNIFSRA